MSDFIRERDANVKEALTVIKQSADDGEEHLTDELNTMMGGLSVPAMRPHHALLSPVPGSLLICGRWSPCRWCHPPASVDSSLCLTVTTVTRARLGMEYSGRGG